MGCSEVELEQDEVLTNEEIDEEYHEVIQDLISVKDGIEESRKECKYQKSKYDWLKDHSIFVPIHLMNSLFRFTAEGEFINTAKQVVDAVTLLIFYQYTAKWQKIKPEYEYADGEILYATNAFCYRALHWSKGRLLNAKAFLKNVGCICAITKPRRGGGTINLLKIKYNELDLNNLVCCSGIA
jgi:hypothetical protein